MRKLTNRPADSIASTSQLMLSNWISVDLSVRLRWRDIEEIGELNDGKHRCVDDHQPKLDLAATIDDAEHTVEKRIDGNQEQEAAFDQQHHGLQVPEAELETLVAFLGNQLAR